MRWSLVVHKLLPAPGCVSPSQSRDGRRGYEFSVTLQKLNSPTRRRGRRRSTSLPGSALYADGGPGSEIDVTHIQSALGETRDWPPRYVTQVPRWREEDAAVAQSLRLDAPPSPPVVSRERWSAEGAGDRVSCDPGDSRPNSAASQEPASRETGARQPVPVTTCPAMAHVVCISEVGGGRDSSKTVRSSLGLVLPHG